MLPDLSPAHILIVVVVALVVVGPKDLPMLLRKIGQFMGKMRGMANEFRASFDEMARQSELDELRKEVEAMRQAASNPSANLGITDDFKLDSEGAYMEQWTASQAEAETTVGHDVVMTPLPPAESAVEPAPEPASDTPAKPKRVRKPKSQSTPSAETEA